MYNLYEQVIEKQHHQSPRRRQIFAKELNYKDHRRERVNEKKKANDSVLEIINNGVSQTFLFQKNNFFVKVFQKNKIYEFEISTNFKEGLGKSKSISTGCKKNFRIDLDNKIPNLSSNNKKKNQNTHLPSTQQGTLELKTKFKETQKQNQKQNKKQKQNQNHQQKLKILGITTQGTLSNPYDVDLSKLGDLNNRLVTYENKECGVTQWFELDASSETLKSNLNFSSVSLLSNFELIYEFSRDLRVEIDQETKLLKFVDPETSDIILQESPPLFVDSEGKRVWGDYVLEHLTCDEKGQEGKNKDLRRQKISIRFAIDQEFARMINERPPQKRWVLVDPQYATFLGGTNNDFGTSVTFDTKGFAYVSGLSKSNNFPFPNANVYSSTLQGSNYNLVVVKTKNGSKLEFSTFVHDTGIRDNDLDDHYYPKIIVDPSDDAPIIAGSVFEWNGNWPTTGNAWQRKEDCTQHDTSSSAGYLLKIGNDGSDLVWSTLICGTSDSFVYVISAFIDKDDSDYNVYFIGSSDTSAFPGYGHTSDLYTCESAPIDSNLIFGKLSNNGSKLVAATCLGTADEDWTIGKGLYVQNGVIAFQGYTFSKSFPTTSGVFQPSSASSNFLTVVGTLDSTTLETQWISYLGGSNKGRAYSIVMDSDDNIYVAGGTKSDDFPTTQDAFCKVKSLDTTSWDGFFAKISGDGTTRLYSSYIGNYNSDESHLGMIAEMHVDLEGQVLLCGTNENNFDMDYYYGSKGYAFIFNSELTQIQKAISYGEYVYSCAIFGHDIENFAVTGESYDLGLLTTDGAFQPNNRDDDHADFIIGGTFTSCVLGYWYPQSPWDGCEICAIGTYSNKTDANSVDDCRPCPFGSYSDLEGMSQCAQCSPGTFQNETGKSACFTCEMGKYSDTYGLKNCIECESGTYNSFEGQQSSSSCVKCPAGTYGLKEGAVNYEESCQNCPMGTYNDERGAKSNLSCTKCPMGSYNDRIGSASNTSCWPCDKGTYNDLEGSTTEYDCQQCPEKYISPEKSSTSCQACPIGYQPNSHQDACVKCGMGYYKDKIDSLCSACPVDHFSNTEGASFCLKCGIKGICLGGSKCAEGRDPDTFCTECQEGYYLRNAECKKCGNSWYILFWVLFVALALALILRYRKKVSKALLLKKNPIFEIYFTFIQLFAAVLAMNISWPTYIDGSIISASSLVNLEISTIITPNCYQNYTFFTKYLIMVLIPIALVAVIVAGYLVFRLISKYKKKDIDWQRVNSKILYSLTLALRYLYIPMAIVSSRPFQTTYQEGLEKTTLDYSPDIDTDSEKYKAFYPWFVFFFFLNVCSIPLLFIAALLISKFKHLSDYWKDKFGWLWEFYRPNRFYWEIVKIFFKFAIIVIPIYSKITDQNYLLLMVLMFVLAMNIFILVFRPYPFLVPTNKHERELKSVWEKISPEDLVSFGLNIILMGIISSGIEKARNVLFFFLYPIGTIFTFMGTRKNFKEMWYQRKKIKKYKDDPNNKKPSNSNTDKSGKEDNVKNNETSESESGTSNDKSSSSSSSEIESNQKVDPVTDIELPPIPSDN
ncbi:insulin-like growth factor binding protein [Anaeramoeba flamelloides]|uniref:Insulin-like growth factor binding protein n=1 Tax=Anaeramoeba flamelloides TaxID=1746091 RepID=A0ABQ8Y5A4_9EUKA|nr:insulin-like growth factor binding protein [Anaeramoeba flamelloides]